MDQSQLAVLNSMLRPISGLMQEPEVTEIMVNGENQVWVKRFGQKPERVECDYAERQIQGTIQILASISGREVGDANSARDKAKVISAGIPGFRFEAWTRPVAVNGPAFSCRKLSSRLIPMHEYVETGAMTQEVCDSLCEAVKTRRNIFVVGATGSGKTTLCNALLQQVDPRDRLLVIENVQELIISSPNCVLLEADEEQGYSMNRLLVSSLRGLPDRIIFGEVRGPEAYGLLKAANTGHPGAIATIHADSARDMLERLEDMVLEGRPEMPMEAIRRRIANTKPLIVFIDQHQRDGRWLPTIDQLITVTGYDAGDYQFSSIFHYSKEQ